MAIQHKVTGAARGKNTQELWRLSSGIIVIALSAYFLLGAAHFFTLDPAMLGKYDKTKWILLLHITGGGIALLTGPLQFWERFRNKRWVLHRQVGRAYLLAILISGSCAVYLSFTTAYAVGWSYAFTLQVWVSVWLTASFLAYRTAVRKKFKLHKEWMTRSYLITVAFVISALLNKLPYIQDKGSFAEVSPSLFWFGWAVPLYIYEIILSLQRKQ